MKKGGVFLLAHRPNRMVKLTLELIAEANKGSPPSSMTELSFSRKDLHKVARLDVLVNLVRLDLSHNRLQSVEALSNCKSLKWLSIANNELKSLHGVESLFNLTVLNGSRNQISSMKEVKALGELRALILNDNQIDSVCKLNGLTALNTLVLSRNPISTIGTSLKKVSSLVKLSLSNCELQDLGSLEGLVVLKELRLSHNEISVLPKDVRKNSQLHIVDLGNNCLKALSDIEVLCMLPCLENLSLRRNPLCSQHSYEDEVKKILPNLQVLDGHPLQSTSKKQHPKEHLILPSMARVKKSEAAEGLSKKPKQGQKRKNADVGDQRISMAEDILDIEKRDLNRIEDDWKQASTVATASDDEKPFIELIVQGESNTTGGLEERKKERLTDPYGRPKKGDSGIVSIINKKAKPSRTQNNRHDTRPGSAFSVSLEEVNIGAGGPSSWDM